MKADDEDDGGHEQKKGGVLLEVSPPVRRGLTVVDGAVFTICRLQLCLLEPGQLQLHAVDQHVTRIGADGLQDGGIERIQSETVQFDLPAPITRQRLGRPQ